MWREHLDEIREASANIFWLFKESQKEFDCVLLN